MVKRKTSLKIRKTHRYLGIIIGIQFLMWTVSGLYFSWTDLDEIHGDDFRKFPAEQTAFTGLSGISEIAPDEKISSVELREISGQPYYFINYSRLINARNGEELDEISEEDAKSIASRHMKDDLKISSVERITETGDHHEFRGNDLPAYVITYDNDKNLKAYIDAKSGSFKSVRFRDWRWFDFLWMTHTMDYDTRDDFNNILLRLFSLSGLITVLSGFVLWFVTSPSIRKLRKSKIRN